MLDDSFHVYDTTLRDGAQGEGMSFSVGDKLAVARLLDELGVGFIEGGWPGALPEGHRVLRPRPHRAVAAARAAGRLRRDPQGRRPGRHRPAGARAAGRGDPGGLPGRQVRPAARAPGAAHHARRRTSPWSPTPSASWSPRDAGSSSTASTSSTATGTTGTTGCGCWRPRSPPARTSACSATPTAACCRWASAGWCARWSSGPASGSACTRRTTPGARWPTRWPRWTPAPPTCRAPRTATASAPATPTCSR